MAEHDLWGTYHTWLFKKNNAWFIKRNAIADLRTMAHSDIALVLEEDGSGRVIKDRYEYRYVIHQNEMVMIMLQAENI
jgi:hypothetical protein